MKNKRTKLTALLLSALMAVSTISSVTWAADLFSDGSEEESTAEASLNDVLHVEEESVADDAPLTGLSADDIVSITFKSDSSFASGIYAEYVTSDGAKGKIGAEQGAKKPASCLAPERAVYFVKVNLSGEQGDKEITVYSDDQLSELQTTFTKLQSITIDEKCNSDFIIPASAGTNAGKNAVEAGYIAVPGSNYLGGTYGHDRVEGTNEYAPSLPLRDATDFLPGKAAYYTGCTVCGKVVTSKYDTGTDIPTSAGSTYEALKKKAEQYLSAYKTAYESGSTLPASDQDVQEGWEPTNTFYVRNLGKNTHNYDTEHPIIIYDSTDSDHSASGSDYIESTYNIYRNYKVGDSDIYSDFSDFKPYNCHMEYGEMVADSSEDSEDAYYYIVVVCKNCKTVKFWDKVYLKDVSGGIDGTYYEQVIDGNIIGFFGKDRSKHYYFDNLDAIEVKDYLKGTTTNNYNILPNGNYRSDGKIPSSYLSDPPEPIFKECGKMGYYYVRSYVKDSDEPVTSERISIPSNHSWGVEEIIKNGDKFTDGTLSQTEDAKLLKDNGKFVYPAKSIDCVTTAKYQVGRHCIFCNAILKVGSLQTVGPNKDRHTWGPYSTGTDPEDDEYTIIDENTHMRYTYVHRICSKCGEREKKISGEYPEAHKFQETRIEDGPKQDPNCGVPGFCTVKLVCKCKLEDDGSERKEEIPPTDKHDFTGSDVKLVIKGSVQIGDNGYAGQEDLPYNVYAEVVRTCTICGKDDSNGINNTPVGKLPVGVDDALRIDTINEGRTVEITEEARKDPNGIPYSCSEGKATITFNWSGKVDGKTVRLDPETVVVPYYPDYTSYAARTDHKPFTRTEIVKKPTTTQEGSAIEITECSVCGEELSRVDVPIAKLGSAPAVKAVTVNYNTVTVTWDVVEGAESYKVYKKSNDLGISKWQVVATVNGTSYTDTGLVTGAKYRYTVRPVVDDVLGEYSKKGVVVCPKLTAPEIKSVTAVSTNKNKITWTKVDGASGYIVQRKTADGSWTRIATVRGGSNINCRDKKAVAGSSYRVRAFRTVEKPNFVKSNVYGPFSTAK